MRWFAVDVGWSMHRKTVAAGRDGRALWVATGTQCAAKESDGFVDGALVRLYASIADVQVRRAAPALVASGLWHDADTLADCAKCLTGHGHTDGWAGIGLLPAGDFYFHDWRDYQLASAGRSDAIERRRERRRKALQRDMVLCGAIRERDRDLCRYCGVLTTWGTRGGDRRSATSGTYDHLDPLDFGTSAPGDDDGGNSLRKVVVACRKCNGVKRDRTPEQAGMDLLPEPGRNLACGQIGPGRRPENQPRDLAGPRVTRETGPGQVRPDLRPGSGQVVASVNGNGHGPGGVS